jgi:Flp pilus assembly protein protease CpaA
MTRSQSLALVGAAYAVAVGVAAAWLTWSPTTGRLWLDTLVAGVLATLVVFAFSRAYQEVIDRVPRFVPRPPSRISAG